MRKRNTNTRIRWKAKKLRISNKKKNLTMTVVGDVMRLPVRSSLVRILTYYRFLLLTGEKITLRVTLNFFTHHYCINSNNNKYTAAFRTSLNLLKPGTKFNPFRLHKNLIIAFNVYNALAKYGFFLFLSLFLTLILLL